MAKLTRIKSPPQKVWRIQDFFVAAAVRKGIADLPKRLAAKDTERTVVQNGRDYRIDWNFAGLRSANRSFTIHHDGSWIYAAGQVVEHGKLQPPHAKGWVDKMITKGTPGEYARADWTYYFNLRNLK